MAFLGSGFARSLVSSCPVSSFARPSCDLDCLRERAAWSRRPHPRPPVLVGSSGRWRRAQVRRGERAVVPLFVTF